MISFGHATSWEPGAPRETSAARHRVATKGPEPLGCGGQGWFVREFCLRLARSLPRPWSQRSESQESAGSAGAPERPPEADDGSTPVEGRSEEHTSELQ